MRRTLALTSEQVGATVRRMCRLPGVMKLLLLAAVLVLPSRSWSAEPIHVVVTIPVLKDFVEQIGGERVRVTSLMTGFESEHTYSPKPSALVAVRNARVLFEVGLGLEVWVSQLVRNAGNQQLLVVTTSRGIGLIRDHMGAEPVSSGQEAHGPAGNPHVWLDPESAATMVRHITEALIKVDPTHAGEYRANQAAYLRQLDETAAFLVQRLRQAPNRRIIVHHPAWPYFARRFGVQVAGTIQTQPASEPSAHHLQTLIEQIRKERIKVIVTEAQLNRKIPDVLAKETGARVVVLTTLPGALPGTETYLDMLRYNVLQLAQALETAKPD